MKCIPVNNISAVVASSVDASYPAVNVLNESALLPFRGASQISTLTLNVDGGASGIGLTGILAKAITITVKDTEDTVVVTEVVDLSGINNYYQWLTQQWVARTGYGFIYPLQMTTHTIEIEIDSGDPETMPEIGVAIAGMVRNWPNAAELELQYIERGAIEETFHDGGIYYAEGEMLKEFNCSLRLELGVNSDFFAFVDGIAAKVKKHPIFWWITDTDNIHWFVYARFSEYPGAPIGNLFGASKFSIIEEKG